MENSIGRLLTADEIVHHIDGNGKNNNIDNLQLMYRIEHNKLHGYLQGKNMVDLLCPICKCIFTRPRNKTFLVSKSTNSTSCSKSCAAKFGHMKKDINRKDEVNILISINVITEYIQYNK